jgi:hypothetical protein
MSFYGLSELKFTAPYFSAMDCILKGEEAIYCSSEITSGWNLFKAMQKHDVTSQEALIMKRGKSWFETNIVRINSAAADNFAKSVRDQQSGHTPVITPAPLNISEWGQPEYLAFWEELIRTRVSSIRFNPNWEYSNGCTFEFAVAVDKDIPILSSQGIPIPASVAIAAVKDAVTKIKGWNTEFDTAKLEANLERIRFSSEGPLSRKRPAGSIKIPLERTTDLATRGKGKNGNTR